MLSNQEKEERKEARRKAKEELKKQARIEKERNQKPVKEITLTIEWKKSRTWGSNPHLEASISYQDGTYEHKSGYTTSGCGYDKESTVIAELFNDTLKYKLYNESLPKIGDEKRPYGLGYWDIGNYEGGIGTNCYYRISEFIGGKFEHIACGKTFDVYKYTDGQVNP